MYENEIAEREILKTIKALSVKAFIGFGRNFLRFSGFQRLFAQFQVAVSKSRAPTPQLLVSRSEWVQRLQTITCTVENLKTVTVVFTGIKPVYNLIGCKFSFCYDNTQPAAVLQ